MRVVLVLLPVVAIFILVTVMFAKMSEIHRSGPFTIEKWRAYHAFFTKMLWALVATCLTMAVIVWYLMFHG